MGIVSFADVYISPVLELLSFSSASLIIREGVLRLCLRFQSNARKPIIFTGARSLSTQVHSVRFDRPRSTLVKSRTMQASRLAPQRRSVSLRFLLCRGQKQTDADAV